MTDAIANKVEKCKACSKDFLIIEQEQKFYKKKDLPFPENCPDCRQKRRLSLRNERKLYKRKCDKCTKDMISTYSPDSKYIVYCQECFWKHLG
tara:strand:+ start:249 stop:527 length:279 start_codon:yes stop_codon:yes gene_type:complete